jgi:hypothetical protein
VVTVWWTDLMKGLTWWVTPVRTESWRERKKRSRRLFYTRTPLPPPPPRPSPFTRAELDDLERWDAELFG